VKVKPTNFQCAFSFRLKVVLFLIAELVLATYVHPRTLISRGSKIAERWREAIV